MESPTKEEKPLTIDKAAFLLLRVRRVFKKKLQVKKEKNYAQDVVFPKSGDLTQINVTTTGTGTGAKPVKKKGVPPLIRSRTVPAIIVPFSILQAQLVKNTGGASSPSAAHQCKDISSKSDFSTPGVDYVQFLTGNTGSPPQSAAAYSPSVHHRLSVHPGFGQPSLASRESISSSAGADSSSASSWNVNTSPSGGGGDGLLLLNATGTTGSPFIPASPHSGSSGGGGGGGGSRTFGRLSRLLNTPVEERRKSSTISLQHWHTSSAAATAHHQRHYLPTPLPHDSYSNNNNHQSLSNTSASDSAGNVWATFATPRLSRRRRSLEAEDLVRPRSVSIDSLLKTHFLHPDGTFRNFSKRLSTGSAHQAKIDSNKSNQGLVTAVEQGNVAKVISILNTTEIDINSLSSDGLSLLDVAVIQKNGALAKILQAHGATEVNHDSFGSWLDNMVVESEKKSENLMARLLKCSTFGSLTSAQLKELEKDFHLSEKRYKKLQKMRTDYAQIRTPDPPAKVTVDVISSTAVRIRLQEADNPEFSICTKYRIEWSQDEEFTPGTTTGWMEMLDLRKLETILSDLETGRRYYFRVCAGNCKGYGHFQNSTPASVIPSSWRDLDGKKPRYAGKSLIFDDIFCEIQKARPEYASELRSVELFRSSCGDSSCNSSTCDTQQQQQQQQQLNSATCFQQHSLQSSHHSCYSSVQGGGGGGGGVGKGGGSGGGSECQNQQAGGGGGGGGGQPQKTKNQKIISIKQLFASAPKFQKNFKRGVFLSCVVYSEDKLLVTNEEFLPTIEIDDSFPSSLHNDFHWLLKVASTWDDVKSFKTDMEKSGSASTFHFRLKLLQAAASMQNALGVTDLGRLYYKTIRDKDNSVVVITTINYMRSTKMISSLNVRWIPLTKMSSRKSTDDLSDVLINSIQEQILYHQVSNIPVGRGLYLGYLKLASSVDVLKIVVGEKTPNMLPHAKIRDNPHVSNEEWTLIQKLTKSKSLDSLNNMETSGGGASSNPDTSRTGTSNSSSAGGACDEKVSEETAAGTTTTTTVGSGGGGGEEEGRGEMEDCAHYSSEFSEAQELFRSQLITALKRLFAFLEIDYESSLNHRLYNAEVIEISNSVSLLVVFPALENVCLVAGQSDRLLQRSDLIPLPLQVFEMIHLSTYQKDFINRYARLSAILEMDTILAQHNQREAFSSSEMATAKQRMNQLQDLQSKIDSAWKNSRWVIDVVTASRDKSFGSASIRALAQLDLRTASNESVASTSDPRPSALATNNSVVKNHEDIHLNFHSKSEQELPFNSPLSPSSAAASSSGLKFSRSENQLSNFGTGSASENGSGGGGGGGNSQHSAHLQSHASAHHLFSITGPGIRKVSVPAQSIISAKAVQERMQFAHNIYSSHSQSDSTISHSSSTNAQSSEQQVSSSASLHNLYRQKSSSQILVPNLVVSDVDMEGESVEVCVNTVVATPVHPLSTPGSPIKAPAVRTSSGSSEPPPVPPRRTAPPPLPPPRQADLERIAAAAAAAELNSADMTSRSEYGGASSSSGSSLVEGSDLYQPSSSSSATAAAVPSVVVIQVYAAYDSGLSEGTSIRLQITNQTTARQVVDLFVKQLNAQVRSRGLEGPVYERTQEFCLVSVIGARERCLRNDFKPLLLQNPWKSGRLYVRKKNEVTAAIDLNSRSN